MSAWLGAGLRPIVSMRFLVTAMVVVGVNLLYGLVVTPNLLLLYLSAVFLLGYGFYLVLVEPANSDQEKKKAGSRRAVVPLVLILLASLALRVTGANWGFPLLTHPDEFSVTEKTAEMLERGDLDTNNYTHPNDISIYASQILYPIVSKALFSGRFAESFATDRKPFYLTSRLVSAASGVLMTAAAYCVGSLAAPEVGIIAAAIFAFFPPFIEGSHYATPDALVTALLLFVLFYCTRYLRSGRPRDLFLALVFSGLSMAEKYPSFLVLVVVLAAVLFRPTLGNTPVFALGPVIPLGERKAAIAVFFVGLASMGIGIYARLTPGFFDLPGAYVSSVLQKPLGPEFVIRTRTITKLVIAAGILASVAGIFLRFLSRERYAGSAFVVVGAPVVLFLVTPSLFVNFGHALYTFSHEARATHVGADGLGYFGNLVFYAKDYVKAAGIVSLLFLLIGTAFVFRERSLLPLLFGFFYWIGLCASGLHWSRWGLPMYAGALLLVSHGIYQCWLLLAPRVGRAGALAVLGVLCAIPAASMALTGVTATWQFALTDTRVVAQLWCQQNGVTPQDAIYDGYTPFIPGSAWKVDFPGSGKELYVVVSSDMYDRYLKEKDRYKVEASMYARIFNMPLMASFTPLKAHYSRSFELGNLAAQAELLQKLGGANAFRGPKILVFRNAELTSPAS